MVMLDPSGRVCFSWTTTSHSSLKVTNVAFVEELSCQKVLDVRDVDPGDSVLAGWLL
jgi:hypothetical protein